MMYVLISRVGDINCMMDPSAMRAEYESPS